MRIASTFSALFAVLLLPMVVAIPTPYVPLTLGSFACPGTVLTIRYSSSAIVGLEVHQRDDGSDWYGPMWDSEFSFPHVNEAYGVF
jgi:hypothetical protein